MGPLKKAGGFEERLYREQLRHTYLKGEVGVEIVGPVHVECPECGKDMILSDDYLCESCRKTVESRPIGHRCPDCGLVRPMADNDYICHECREAHP